MTLLALVVGSVSLLGRSAARTSPAQQAAPLRIVVGDLTVATIDRRVLETHTPDQLSRVRRLIMRQVPAAAWVAQRHARVRFINNRSATALLAINALNSATGVPLTRRPVESVIDAPIMRQILKNDCESAALSILLTGQGKPVSQLRIQRTLPRSGPLDPRADGPSTVWGDPDLGFVGRPNGGGVAGGFGVYPRPVVQAARRLGASLENLSGSPAATIYDRLLAGRPVIAWIGLSAGPYGTWSSPAGRTITVNYGEHTVVLRGVNNDGSLSVSNPLKGTAENWTRAQFELLWERLGRRAIAG